MLNEVEILNQNQAKLRLKNCLLLFIKQ